MSSSSRAPLVSSSSLTTRRWLPTGSSSGTVTRATRPRLASSMVTGTPRIEMEFCADFGSIAREVCTSMTVEGRDDLVRVDVQGYVFAHARPFVRCVTDPAGT